MNDIDLKMTGIKQDPQSQFLFLYNKFVLGTSIAQDNLLKLQ